MNIDVILSFVISYGLKLVSAVLVLIAGFWLAGKFTKYLRKVLEKRSIDVSLSSFLTSFLNILFKILTILISVASVGVEMTSITAILAAASLAVGMALSGTLQNFAGGVIILFLKPFKVSDVIEAQGFVGTVKEIAMFTTMIITPDNKCIFIPNGSLANGAIINYTREGIRRLETIYDIAYGDDVDKARKILTTIISADNRVYKDPTPIIVVSTLGSSSISIMVRIWTSAADLVPVQFDLNEKVYKTFPAEGLNFPFPQMDVHIN
ncbi:MAG: mechanosensitive ion channel [Prevotellaceae bacterium]|jgi:small conductance mechanosensitive channel|nr:mechanosensitive ion channel [Prevotellaceae bacterium]